MNSSSSGGVGLSTLLLVAFVVLKLTHVIDWSWWWVLSPLWISLIIAIVLIIVLVVFEIFLDNRKSKALSEKSDWQQRVEEMQRRQALNSKQ